MKNYNPIVRTLCPSISKYGCGYSNEKYYDYLTSNIMIIEFTRSFVFYLAYLIIKNSQP